MHIYFSGIGGVGLGPLAEIALDAGYKVSGSDNSTSLMIDELKKRGVSIHLSQDTENIAGVHQKTPIDWFVYTAALPQDHPELQFAHKHSIKTSKRDELLAFIIKEKNLNLIAVAGTHGKTTTTAMVVWLFKKLNIPVSYSIGSQISFGPSGSYNSLSEYFVYECDEFDRNFLYFHPYLSLLVSYDYDHADTYPTQSDYKQAFRQFLSQSRQVLSWADPDIVDLKGTLKQITLFDSTDLKGLKELQLAGAHNRRNGYLAIAAIMKLFNKGFEYTASQLNSFPGTARRFEKLGDNLYTDYAHHPTEIAATIQMARELSDNVTVVYQPHQNSRQYEMKNQYSDCFDGARKIYWLPTYLSRENEELAILTPKELSKDISDTPVTSADINDTLWKNIIRERDEGSLVLLMGAGSIDAWARQQLLLGA